MLRRVFLIAALAATLAVTFASDPLGAQSRDAVERAARDSIRSLSLQTDLPREEEPMRVPIPAELIWAALVCALALIAYSLRDTLPGWRRRSDPEWDAAAGGGEGAVAAELDALAMADRMSRDGRLVEAMHMLLLQGLADIRGRLGLEFADSLTSREILRVTRLSPNGRTSLRAIIAAVERTYFGGYPAAPADYAACRDNFEALRSALQSGGPA